MVKVYSRYKAIAAGLFGLGLFAFVRPLLAAIAFDGQPIKPEIQIVESVEVRHCGAHLAGVRPVRAPGRTHIDHGSIPDLKSQPGAPALYAAEAPQDVVMSVRRLTLNRMGYEATSPDTWDPITKLWIRFGASTLKGPPRLLLNVGCAFGSSSVKAATVGAKVICNDLDERHLTALSVSVPEELKAQFVFLPGDYCADCTLRDLKQAGSVDAILLSRVLHFFSPEQFQRALKISYDLLRSGGRIYIVTSSPYLKSLQNLSAMFEYKKKRGYRWPGYLDGQTDKVSHYFPSAKNRYPESMNFVDPDILTREVELAGFSVKRPAYYLTDIALPKEHLLDGRELVGIVAEKI